MCNISNKSKVLVLQILLVFISCGNYVKKIENTITTINNSELIIEFPNKPVINIEEIGAIQYKSDLDTIVLNQNNLRGTILYLGKFKNQHTIEELKAMTLDSFPIQKGGIIPFKFNFKDTGGYILDGYIKDIVLLKKHNEDGSSKAITHQVKVSKKITVVKEYTQGDEELDNVRVLLRFPDKTRVNFEEYGEIIYKSYLDTINLTTKDLRTTSFVFGKFKNVRTISELEGKTTDGYNISKTEKVIPFGVTFDKEGEFILDGYVEDIVLLNNYNNQNDTRMITEKTKISKKVTVVKE